jgi:hypothetical protein
MLNLLYVLLWYFLTNLLTSVKFLFVVSTLYLSLARLRSLTRENRYVLAAELPSLVFRLLFLHLKIQTVHCYRHQQLSYILIILYYSTISWWSELILVAIVQVIAWTLFVSCAGTDCEGVICTELECPSLQYIPLGQCCPVCAGEQTYFFTLQSHSTMRSALIWGRVLIS